MAKFPAREAEIVALALKLIKGVSENPETFPSPPEPPEQLAAKLQRYQDSAKAAEETTGAARAAHDLKDQDLDDLTEAMRSYLKYAESMAGRDESKLAMVGWAGRASRTALELPEQPRNVEVLRSGKGWVSLDWKQPSDGGEVGAYKVEVSRPEEGVWRNVGTAMGTEIRLDDQERGVELMYRVIALNRLGESKPSNVERLIL